MIWAQTDASGCVVRAYSGASAPDSNYQAAPGAPSAAAAARMMVVDGELVARPTLPAFDVGETINLPVLPLGTSLRIHDLTGETVLLDMVTEAADWSDTLSLPDAGRYEIEIIPPAPLLPVSRRFEV